MLTDCCGGSTLPPRAQDRKEAGAVDQCSTTAAAIITNAYDVGTTIAIKPDTSFVAPTPCTTTAAVDVRQTLAISG